MALPLLTGREHRNIVHEVLICFIGSPFAGHRDDREDFPMTCRNGLPPAGKACQIWTSAGCRRFNDEAAGAHLALCPCGAPTCKHRISDLVADTEACNSHIVSSAANGTDWNDCTPHCK